MIGVIETTLVERGDRVTAGQPLAILRSHVKRQSLAVALSVRKFAARLDKQLEQTRLALAGGDPAEVERRAHWLAGGAGTVGYDAFTAPARELEAAARDNDAAAAELVLQRLFQMAGQPVLPEVAAQ